MMVLQVIFWLCAALMVYSYLIYPVLLYVFSLNKKDNTIVYENNNELPVVCLLMSVYNEESVIEKKLKSLVLQNYPKEKLFVLIGSDGSSDNTESIIKNYALKNTNIILRRFDERLGKPGVINHLAKLAKQYQSQVLIPTDANVFFKNDTVFELVKHFKNPEIGLVGANVVNNIVQFNGISVQEKTYIQGENRVKYWEGLNFGTIMGAFGASYAVRENLYKPVKDKFNVDDFFITMNVLRSGGKAIINSNAICYEDVSNDIGEEFRRKRRIATGNYQNLVEFGPFILNPFSTVGFCFISHKLIKWFGPFFIVVSLLSSGWLAIWNKFYLLLFILQLLLVLTPVMDLLLKKINLHIGLLRFAAYFYMMNIAVLEGFINYLKGNESNAWTPTKRNA